MIIHGANVWRGNEGFLPLDVRVEGERIAEVGYGLSGDETVAVRGTLIPGMIDLHTHGHAAFDTMQGEASVRAMSAAYLKRGVTAFLPTTMNAPIDETAAAIAAIGRVMGDAPGARVLGAHMEGPFIDHGYRGAQMAAAILDPTIDRFRALCGGREEIVKLLTIAPERPGAEAVIRYAHEKGILVSAGHTNATYEQAVEAIDWGVRQFTHLFNAMSPIRHRTPGAPTAALLDGRVTVQLIADGVHTHPAILRLVATAKPEGLCLITDSMMAAGLEDGLYELGGQDVIVKNGEARLREGNLAGSLLTMDEALRRMTALAALPLARVVAMATLNPARALGIADMGRIEPGYMADLCLLDDKLRPARTWISGKTVYEA
jgi:N-acetylglucosamine-6-phosphate deacetylase